MLPLIRKYMTLNGRKAIVTGATRGIGHAIAVRLMADGADVLVTGTRPDGAGPKGTRYCAADFSTRSGVEDCAKVIVDFAPDILVNNAGINKLGKFAEIDPADFERIQQVNVHAVFRLSQSVLPAMRARNWGRIVNVGSIWGIIGKELRASYSASKHALVGLTASLAAEVAAAGIVVNCISPGPIETEMTAANLSPAMLAELLKSVPAGRLGHPEEVADLVAWLVSPQNTFVMGQNIAIDGGMLRV